MIAKRNKDKKIIRTIAIIFKFFGLFVFLVLG